MQRLITSCALSAVALLGCDARAGEDYRGEVLLEMKGSLVLEAGKLAPDAVPALVFENHSQPDSFLILDVDAHGKFPASFTIDVMSPPPAAAMEESPGLPAYAVAYISAMAPDHEDVITYFTGDNVYDGKVWCNNPDNTDCYRSIDVCNKRTHQCYHELARCTPRPTMGVDAPRCDDDAIDEVLEQSGDASLAYHFAKFAGLSTNYILLYLDSAAPAGSAHKYLLGWPDYSTFPARIFPNDEPLEAGYHLVHLRKSDDMERARGSECRDRIEQRYMSEYNEEHGTSYKLYEDLQMEILQAGGLPQEVPEVLVLDRKIVSAWYDEGCQRDTVYTPVDPESHPITVVLGARELDAER
jgi:hypothetical protein